MPKYKPGTTAIGPVTGSLYIRDAEGHWSTPGYVGRYSDDEITNCGFLHITPPRPLVSAPASLLALEARVADLEARLSALDSGVS